MTRSKIMKRIRTRVLKRNKNCLILVCGGTGTGKSISAITMALEINPDFDLTKHIVFGAREFMNLLNSKTLKRGDVVIWDEAGVGLPAREWYSILNRAVSFVLQTFRHKNLVVFFTTPDLGFVDISLRKLFHYYFEASDSSINYKTNICTLKPMQLQLNPRFGKAYFKYPRMRRKDGRVITIMKFNVPLLDKEKIKVYEKQKERFTSMLNKRLGAAIDRVEAKKEKEPTDIGKIVDVVKKDIDKYTKEYGGRIIVDKHKLSTMLKLSQRTTLKVKSLVESWLK